MVFHQVYYSQHYLFISTLISAKVKFPVHEMNGTKKKTWEGGEVLMGGVLMGHRIAVLRCLHFPT